VVNDLIEIDTVLLAMAMAGLGLTTHAGVDLISVSKDAMWASPSRHPLS
jgi:uncharacterized membrane protein YadS